MYLTDYMLPTYNSTYIYSCSYLSVNQFCPQYKTGSNSIYENII